MATALVERYTPDEPEEIQNEAAVRCAAWLGHTAAGSIGKVETAAQHRGRAEPCVRLGTGGKGPPRVQDAVTGRFLAQGGRDLIRSGDSMYVIHVSRMGRVKLLPAPAGTSRVTPTRILGRYARRPTGRPPPRRGISHTRAWSS